MGRFAIISVLGVVSSFIAYLLVSKYNAYPPLMEGQKIRHQFIPDSYREGRENFRDAVKRIKKAELVTLVLSEDDDLTIDVGVIPGDEEKLMLYLSGVHGPEGHAGSGVQAGILWELNELQSASAWPADFPTIIFVHAVNPYGFWSGRRWNENNVDLNRNVLSAERFKELIAKGPPEPYLKIVQKHIINSQRPLLSWFDANIYYYVLAARALIIHGYNNLKHALVTGQYHFEKGLFYGGQELQASWVLLKQFLHERNYLQMREIIMLDVHTGLGPSGKDTLFISRGADLVNKSGYLPEDDYGRGINSYLGDEGAGKGYEDTDGGSVNILEWFPQRTLGIGIGQEFGTVNSVAVSRALVLDHYAHFWHVGNESRKKAYERTRGVFYLRLDGWKQSVVDRGVRVFGQLLKFWNHEIPSLLK